MSGKPHNGPHVGSLGFRMCVYFAVNPDEWLTARDAAHKFDAPSRTVFFATRKAIEEGWLRKETLTPGKPSTYWPGPKLLEAMGSL